MKQMLPKISYVCPIPTIIPPLGREQPTFRLYRRYHSEGRTSSQSCTRAAISRGWTTSLGKSSQNRPRCCGIFQSFCRQRLRRVCCANGRCMVLPTTRSSQDSLARRATHVLLLRTKSLKPRVSPTSHSYTGTGESLLFECKPNGVVVYGTTDANPYYVWTGEEGLGLGGDPHIR